MCGRFTQTLNKEALQLRFEFGGSADTEVQPRFNTAPTQECPVIINNDGDLFAYGEAMAGFLPKVNSMLADAGSPKRYRNLFAVTLGTGFGGGIVRDGQLLGKGHNQVESLHDPTAHAEILALGAACQAAGDWRLPGATLYVTLEP